MAWWRQRNGPCDTLWPSHKFTWHSLTYFFRCRLFSPPATCVSVSSDYAPFFLHTIGYSCNVPGPCLLCRYPTTMLLHGGLLDTHTMAVCPRSCTITMLIFVISCFFPLSLCHCFLTSLPLVMQVVYICKDACLLVFHKKSAPPLTFPYVGDLCPD